MNPAIEVNGLYKSYGENQVLKGVGFSVCSGEIFALLGSNGAGKTTTLECLEGLRRYDTGRIEVNGSIGVQLQSSSLPEDITAEEACRLFSLWKKEPLKPYMPLGLEKIGKKKYFSLSTGQKRRLHLALALIGEPDILILDEPTAGLDVEGRAELHREIRRLREEGTTILLASHDMAEVESLCDRIAILRDGEIAFLGTAKELSSSCSGESRIYIKTDSEGTEKEFSHCGFAGLEQGYAVYTASDLSEALLELLNSYRSDGCRVLDIRIERPSLEECYIRVAGGETK